MAFRHDNKVKTNFTKIRITLASPQEIQEASCGEVLKPETINYRSYKPERDGLFCEKIFGPTKDYECSCGKYKRIRYKGVVCDRCGVEVTEKKVRRERSGHIQLVVPIAHIWYFRSSPNKIGYLLGLPSKKLDAIIYYEKYIVLQAGVLAPQLDADGNVLVEGVNTGDLIDEDARQELFERLDRDYKGNQQLDDSDPDKFICKMGAEAILIMLKNLDLDKLSHELREIANNDGSQQRRTEALKRLNIVQSFINSRAYNKPEWMILTTLPVIPPELRPLVPLDGGRFATSDLNDLYRRVIIRNNRLKRLIEIKAPDVILRNEKRMLQEAVDSLIDNSRKSNAMKSELNRPLKSLTDGLKGKQGRFRQNLLGKRVDYSARSVIVVGPELNMHECGLPKEMAAELYKPFIIRKLIERGIVKTVKSAKKFIDRKDPVIWDILEHVMKGHPVLLNRAPTLHRLGIQAFQPKLIEGKAIQLHPLACTAFNADFDGDQMAVHLPLGNEAVLEAQMLMLASHNILNPANGAPITVPSQDMVLGLYYITKERPGVKGEGLTFYSPEEVKIAYNERAVDVHAIINVRVDDIDEDGNPINHIVEKTTVGRVLVNEFVPKECGYLNILLSKKSLRNVIGDVIEKCGVARTAQFLDKIKNMGYYNAFKGGLSFNLADVIVPEEKTSLVNEGYAEVDDIMAQYNMGILTNNERYNKIIDVWTHVNQELTNVVMKKLSSDNQGFNSIYMMLDSGARGSREQIRQLSGMRGLMAKPQKAGAEGNQIIENPILANFKEGLSVLEYFISTHGARKGLADTALKTADAGYLTRRLVDVSHDVIVTEEDCGTLRGLVATEIKKNEEVVVTLYERILGRVSVHDVIDPRNGEIIVKSGEEIDEAKAKIIEESPIERVEIRSVLTCEAKHGVCAKCYGRNLATGRLVNKGEAVGVIAAQSIGEPGTQLTLRTFHVGGVASNAAVDNSITAKYDGRIEIDELRTVDAVVPETGESYMAVTSRMAEMRLMDLNTNMPLVTQPIPYGSKLFVNSGDILKKGDKICEFDPFNAVIVSEVSGTVQFDSLIKDNTFKAESDENTGMEERVIIESKDKTKAPAAMIVGPDGVALKTYNLPVGAHLQIKDGQQIQAGHIIVKIPRAVGSAGDITGGLPRVTELFEARNPSNPAVVAKIDGTVSFGKIKRGNRELFIEPKDKDVKSVSEVTKAKADTKGKDKNKEREDDNKNYLISLSKQILVQEGDYVRAGTPLSDGAVTPADILAIKGPTAVQEYIVNEVQDVYRLQGVKINDKHFEVIVRQMMRKVRIEDPGETNFLEGQIVDRREFIEENDKIWGRKYITNKGDSTKFEEGQIVTMRSLNDENSSLKRRDLRQIEARDARPATSVQILQGITRAALQTRSFISAASFQETPRVLNEAAINAKVDCLEGMKENVICGHKIPAGTGLREYDKLIVTSMDDYQMKANMSRSVTDFDDISDSEE